MRLAQEFTVPLLLLLPALSLAEDEPAAHLLAEFSPAGMAPIRSVALSQEGQSAWVSSLSSTVSRISLADGKVLESITAHPGWVPALALSASGTLATTGQDARARLWGTDGAAGVSLDGHRWPVRAVAWSTNGSMIATASWDETARLWDAATGTLIREFVGHESSLRAVAISPNGTRLLTGSLDDTARLWDVATGAELQHLSINAAWVTAVAFSPDGARLLTASADGVARLWSASSGALLRTYAGHEDTITSASFSPDGTRVMTAGWDGTVRIWNTVAANQVRMLEVSHLPVRAAAWSTAGNRVVTGGDDRALRVWDTALPAILPGDLTGDSCVGLGDFFALAGSWGSLFGIADFFALATNWGMCSPDKESGH